MHRILAQGKIFLSRDATRPIGKWSIESFKQGVEFNLHISTEYCDSYALPKQGTPKRLLLPQARSEKPIEPTDYTVTYKDPFEEHKHLLF